MSFHSLDFVVFYIIVFCVYWSLPRIGQNIFLLAASFVFYGYIHPWFLYPMLASTILDYFCALGMGRWPEKKKVFLWMTLVGNLSLLGVFKYYNFFVENARVALDLMGIPVSDWTLSVVLPAGISFYTFQTLSYTIDVYRGKFQPRRNFITFAVYVTFFPQLVAGPIERATRLLGQFEKNRFINPDAIRTGLYMMIWGFFKKVVIADTVAIYANKVFALEDPSFLILWAGVFAFYIQIFADFSAYSDIARGAARLLGFELMLNFNHPYISRSVQEFWTRWHISLSTWLRDYVTISLHHYPWWRRHRNLNLLLTLLLCGLWHGASWNFVVWGLFCGVNLICYPYYEAWFINKIFRREPFLSIANWLAVFLLTNIAFLLFREHSLKYLIHHLTMNPFANTPLQIRAATQIFILTFLYSLPIWIHAFYDVYLCKKIQRLQGAFAWTYALETGATVLVFLGILVLHTTLTADFIYFQF